MYLSCLRDKRRSQIGLTLKQKIIINYFLNNLELI